MRVIDLALKDLMQTVRDWKAAAFLLAMPIVFTLLMGFLFSGTNGQVDPRLPVGFFDQDGNSILRADLFDLLNASDTVRPIVPEGEGANIDSLEKKVGDEEWAALVIVPKGYGDQVLAGEDARLTIIVDESSLAGSTARHSIQVAVTRLVGAVQTARLSAQMIDKQIGFTGETARLRFFEEALAKAADAWREPPLTVVVTRPEISAEGEGDDAGESNSFAHSSPAMMIQFSIAGLIGSAEILVLERKSKALQRLLTTAISRLGIILGHFLAIFALILLQLVLLVVFGQLALGVDYMREPLATFIVMVTMALWTASLGLLIGVLAKTEEQAVMFAIIPMFVLSALGGAWMPLETTSETFQTIGHLTPTAWAMDGFRNIVVRGLGIESVLLPAAVMLAYGAGFFVLAVWRFEFE